MPIQGLNPGDRVVELAGLVVSAAVVTGAISGACLVWRLGKSWLLSGGGLIVGAVIGFGVGQLIARIFYRTGANATVVKVGSASLSSSIPAGLAGGISTGFAIAVIALLIFGARSQAPVLFGTAIGCGLVLGVLFACLGSLT